jgi:hypothetical protein
LNFYPNQQEKERVMKRTFFAMLVATTALVPSAVAAQTTNETAPAQEATTQPQQQARPLTAASLNNQPIYDQAGQEFGRVTNFVRSQDNQIFAVVTLTDNRQVLVPVKLIAYDNDRLLIQDQSNRRERQLKDRGAAARPERPGAAGRPTGHGSTGGTSGDGAATNS